MAGRVLLFIDANQYLPIYALVAGKRLLDLIEEQRAHIFVTNQIVEEVERGKLRLAGTFFVEQLKNVPLTTFAVPDHLFGLGDEQSKELRDRLKDLSSLLSRAKKDTTELVLRTLQEISQSVDVTSKRLQPLFATAVKPSVDEMNRARDRRERGNPPGKLDDPLGDQITWEQLLTRCATVDRVWLITKDRDFCTLVEKQLLLNPLLSKDIRRVSPNIEIRLFDTLLEGLTDFAKNAGVEAKEVPNEKEAEQIELEEKSFSSFRYNIPDLSEQLDIVLGIGAAMAPDRYEPTDAFKARLDRVLSEVFRDKEPPHIGGASAG